MKTAPFIAAILLSAGAAHGQVFKCTEANGKVTFSDSPCAGGKALDIRPNTIDSRESREQVLQKELREMRTEMDRMRQAPAPSQQYGRTESDLQAELSGTRECADARRSYEMEERSVKPTAVASKRRAMYAACGMREPDMTVNTPVIVVR